MQKSTCTKCKIKKDTSLFTPRKDRIKPHASWCRQCLAKKRTAEYRDDKKKHREYKSAWYAKNPGYHLEARFGISYIEYTKILKDQQSKCKICQTKASELRIKMAVDHCHETGKIRGLLCDRCNRGLGFFKDSIELLSMAIEYISKN